MGRRATTGRFDTRDELVDRIEHLYKNSRMSVAAIAGNVGISPATCGKIVDDFNAARPKQAPMPRVRERDRALTVEEMEAIERMTENAKNVLGHCGHGYMPEACRVHLDPRTLNDVFADDDLNLAYMDRPVILGEYAWKSIRRRNYERKEDECAKD